MAKEDKFDVIIIGGGPAGMMAAGRAAELGRSVLLLEKNPTLGKKLLLTGGGRCNLANNKQNIRELAAQYQESAKFLMSTFSQFDAANAIAFFNCRGMKTKEEAGGRIFPVSNKSQSVLDILVKYMEKGDVTVKTNAIVAGISLDEKKETIAIKLKDKQILTARSCIIATGSLAYPATGSTGDGFNWLEKLGHTIVNNNFSLVPIAIKDEWVKKLSGLTLSDIKLTLLQNGKKHNVQSGTVLFTHFGISGPAILNISKDVGKLLTSGEVIILLDLFPKLDQGALQQILKKTLTAESNKKLKNSLTELIPSTLVPSILKNTGINGETANHSVKRENRIKLVKHLKEIPLHIKGLLGADTAMAYSGGVDIKEVNFKTMQSRLVPRIYIIGDALNIDRPTGGYSLQLCWTTGFVAGSHA